MTTTTLDQTAPVSSRPQIWAGWTLTGLVALFLVKRIGCGGQSSSALSDASAEDDSRA